MKCLLKVSRNSWQTVLGTTFLLLTLFLAACSDRGDAEPTRQNLDAATPIVTVAPTATAVAEPTPTLAPTPILPAITINEQIITEAGRLNVSATSPDAGWLVIYAGDSGKPNEVLGYTAVAPGNNNDLTITIDPKQATDNLIAMLHEDSGQPGTFEFPEQDQPLAEATAVTFAVDIQLPKPTIIATDQEIGPDGVITIDTVFSEEAAWLVVYAQTPAGLGPRLGQIPLTAGEHNNLRLPIRLRNASTQLLAQLYTDAEQPGGFDPLNDQPLQHKDQPVEATLQVALPPDIFAYDQPVIDGQIIVERVVSNGAGWLTAAFFEDGQPGLIIGFAALENGLNEQLIVDVGGTAVTPQLTLQLHQDVTEGDEFDFPVSDPVAMYNENPVDPLIINTNAGNYLITHDQPISSNNTLSVPLIVTDLDTWLTIYTNNEGQPGELIGHQWLPAGINHDVIVEITPPANQDSLLALLHQDVGTPQEFEFPDGLDTPLQRNRAFIQSPITLITTE